MKSAGDVTLRLNMRFFSTVDRQNGGTADGSDQVARDAAVLASMTGGHGFNGQHGCFFPGIRDCYVRMSEMRYEFFVETPPYFNR